MRKFYILLFFTITLLFSTDLLIGQTFSGEWTTDYVTADDIAKVPNDNYTGYNTQAVAVVEEDAFVAVVNRSSRNAHYLVGYRNASYLTGRLGVYGYGGEMENYQMPWVINFDQEFMYDVNDITAMGNIVYVANNDEQNHSILAFELRADSIYTHPQRFKTGADYLWGIDNDKNGRIYILKDGVDENTGSVMILENPDVTPVWNSSGNSGTILHEFDLPEPGSFRGITVNEDGSLLYVSNWDSNRVYCFVGDPETGYTINNNFNFEVQDTVVTPKSGGTIGVGPHGINFMFDKNILFVTHDSDYQTGVAYEYGRIYLLEPNTGGILDTIDIAGWNSKTDEDGKYDDPDTLGLSSGYASVNCVDFDENHNVYSQSYWGWAIDKRRYSLELPTIEITIVSVELTDKIIPDNFSLMQNYPNPFNPTTTIEFSVNKNENISLQVYSITGELISNLISNENYTKGNYRITLDGSKLSSGTYFYKLSNGVNTLTKKMTLLK